MTDQQEIDQRNSVFWDELCGTTLAQSIGVVDRSAESLRRLDAAYMALYPYLPSQLRGPRAPGEMLLEIGLGYGTVSQRLAAAGYHYHGLDIADGPVAMVRERLRMLHITGAESRVVTGSALAIPHAEETFDHVVSIGCLHHTGDLPRAVSEVQRVLRPGGTAMVMLYNRHALRQLLLHWQAQATRWRGQRYDDQRIRAAYDADTTGDAAPETVFVTVRQVRRELFASFAKVRVERHNFDPYYLGSIGKTPLWLARERTLNSVARILGLDLYIHARK